MHTNLTPDPPYPNRRSLPLLWVALAACSGAPPVPASPNPTHKPKMVVVSPGTPPRIRNFSESRPVISLTYLAGYIYAANPTRVLRYDVRTGKHVRITRRQGLPPGRLLAIAAHRASGLWVATARGIFQHHDRKWRAHGQVKGTVLALSATARGLWCGGTHGLVLLEGGKQRRHLEGATVNHLVPAGERLWIGTAADGVHLHHKGKVTRQQQCPSHVSGLTRIGEDGVMAAGRDTIAYHDGSYWSTYTLTPGGRVRWIQQMDDGALVAHGDRLLLVRPGAAKGSHSVRLEGKAPREAPWRYKAPHLRADVVKQWLPRRPTALLGHEGHALVGTASLGVALLGRGKVRWFRTHDLLGQRERLRMACARGTCYIPGARGGAFKQAGKKISRVVVTPSPGAVVQAFTNDQWGGVVSLHTPAGRPSLVVSELHPSGRFVPVYEATIKIPEKNRLRVRFVRTDPTGRMWIGLWAVGAKHRQAWGLVVMRPPPSHAAVTWDPGRNKAAASDDDGAAAEKVPQEAPSFFHRSTLLPGESRPARSLAIPNDARDVFFDRHNIWVATGDGVCLIRGTEAGTEVKLTTENEGIRSELIYGFARAPGGGHLLVASFAGVGRQQGRRWIFDLDRPLRTATRKLLVRGDVLWAGTTQGLARVRGRRALVLDRKVGLAHDAVQDIYLDNINRRMWVLTEGGLSVVSLKGL